MSQPRIEVQHWLLAKSVRTYGTSIREADLLGVAFSYSVPPDTEFPREKRPVVLFLRLTAREAGLTEVLVQVHHRQSSGEWTRTTDWSNPLRPLVFPRDRTVVWAEYITLPHAVLVGYGVYAVTIYFREPDLETHDDGGVDGDSDRLESPAWQDADPLPWDPDELGWVFGAVDFFEVVKP